MVKPQPATRIEQPPATSVNVPDVFDGELAAFLRHLAAENKAPRTAENYRDATRQLYTFLRDQGMPTQIEHVKREHIESFIADLLERWSALNAETRFKGIQQFFKWASSEHIIGANPMANMRPPKTELQPPDIPSLDSLRALLRACDGRDFEGRRDAAIVAIFADTGARLSELRGMQLTREDDIGDLDLAAGTVVVFGKGRRWRTLSIGRDVTRRLDRYLRLRKQHPYSHLPDLWLGKRGRLTNSGIQQMIRRKGREAGLGNSFHPHQLRHLFAHLWRVNGGGDDELMRLAGWSSRTMLSRYGASAADERAREMHKRLSPMDRL